jgi:hypothetical protein
MVLTHENEGKNTKKQHSRHYKMIVPLFQNTEYYYEKLFFIQNYTATRASTWGEYMKHVLYMESEFCSSHLNNGTFHPTIILI